MDSSAREIAEALGRQFPREFGQLKLWGIADLRRPGEEDHGLQAVSADGDWLRLQFVYDEILAICEPKGLRDASGVSSFSTRLPFASRSIGWGR